ncbi:unnamed protein product [Allacma fusca]|uniref:Uncharacterized protein n=1 Tax=Allacma fusca TaxID=39272 RepID=A0A8J2K9N5_9HEXA|nr:unnamed protein product [Allacma fusca]
MLSRKLITAIYLALTIFSIEAAQQRIVGSPDARFVINSDANSFEYILEANGKTVLKGQLGLAVPSVAGRATETCESGESDACFEYGDYARLYLTAPKGESNCATVEWYSNFGRRLEDCFDLLSGVHWYGGGETKVQTWPIETEKRDEAPFVAGDFLQPNVQFGGLLDTYWISTSGVAIHVQEDSPLFTSWNTTHPNQFCFVAQDRAPYVERDAVRLKYDICVPKAGETFKDVHLRSLKKYYTLPTEIPDETMIVYPFWSTWAEYKADINQTLVVQMAKRLIEEGYTTNSHIQIDDNWETCYGEAEFNSNKFPDLPGMMRELGELGINRTTVWVHPFINFNCPSFQTAFDKEYFVKDVRNKQTITWWWEGQNSGLIDFTNPEAVNWYRARLQKLQTDTGITSFKFDAGESTWLPPSVKPANGDVNLLPNLMSTKYVESVAAFGGMIETRTGHRNQNLAIFLRMLDKDSRWGYDNGLKSMIPSLLLFSILGYSFVLPDMIGGNAYGSESPSNEMYIRWAQVNVFMPSWQFSVLPWDRDPTGLRDRAVKEAVELRISYASKFLEAARQTVEDGSPMNRPMWWVDPEDPETYTIDDQFMLGDDILAAPVTTEGALSRDIYLPKGTWLLPSNNLTFTGPQWLRSWPAPVDYLPFFVRQ